MRNALVVTALLLAGCAVDLSSRAREAVRSDVAAELDSVATTHGSQDETLLALVQAVATLQGSVDGLATDVATLQAEVEGLKTTVDGLPTDVAAPTDVTSAVATLQSDLAAVEASIVANLEREVIYAWDDTNGATTGSHADLVAAASQGRELLVARQTSGASDWVVHHCARAFYDWSVDTVTCFTAPVADASASTDGATSTLESDGILFQIVSSAGTGGGQLSSQFWDISTTSQTIQGATTLPLGAMVWTAAP